MVETASIRGGSERPEMGPVRRRRAGAAAAGVARDAAAASCRNCNRSRGRAPRVDLPACLRSSGSRAATAPGSASVITPRAARRRARVAIRDPRLLRLQRRHHPRAVAGAGRARRETLCGRYARPWRRQARAAISAMSASSRTISPISSRWLRKTVPSAPLTLVGHSSGGGFALRVAGSPIQNLFERFVLLRALSRLRRPDHPAGVPAAGPRADIPRIIGLLRCAQSAITCCEALPVLALAVPPNSRKTLVSTYTDRSDAQLCGARRRLPPRSRRRDQAACTIISRRRRRIDACGQICRSRAWREGRGRRQGARRHQPHGYRRRAEGGIHHRRGRRHARHGRVAAAMRRGWQHDRQPQAAEALADINEMTRRVRQSRIYNLASLMLIMWGALVFAGYLGSFLLAAPGRLFLDRAECRRESRDRLRSAPSDIARPAFAPSISGC